MLGNARRIKLTHPSAYQISIVTGPGTYSNSDHTEIAFMDKAGEFITTPIEPFQEYYDYQVYPYVPNDLIESFLAEYAAN